MHKKFSGNRIIKHHDEITLSVNKYVNNVVKEYTNKIRTVKKELETANKALRKLEKKYQRSGMQKESFLVKIGKYKATKASFEVEIQDYQEKIDEMEDFNDQIISMLEYLKSNINVFVRDVASLKQAFDDEVVCLGKEIEELRIEKEKTEKAHVKELAKKDKKLAKMDRKLAKTDRKLRKQVETILLQVFENDNSDKKLEDKLKVALGKNLEVKQNKSSKSKARLKIQSKNSTDSKSNTINKKTPNKSKKQESKSLKESTLVNKIKNETVNFKEVNKMNKNEVSSTKQNSEKIDKTGCHIF